MRRTAEKRRVTKESSIEIALNLDGEGRAEIETGIGFFDHMLNSFAMHGRFDLKVRAIGDIHVDCHHTVEDTGILLGQAFLEALGDKKGIERFASLHLPMDDALVLCAVDISGRPYFSFSPYLPFEMCGEFQSGMCEEFFRAFAMNGGINLHMKLIDGRNMHHIIEAFFKGAAVALRRAVAVTGSALPTVKGVL